MNIQRVLEVEVDDALSDAADTAGLYIAQKYDLDEQELSNTLFQAFTRIYEQEIKEAELTRPLSERLNDLADHQHQEAKEKGR